MERKTVIERFYRWTLSMAGRPDADRVLAVVSFCESSFFPIPPDAFLIPMVLAQRDKAWRLAAICTVASVLGGILGYAIGAFLYDTVGQWLIRIYGLQGKAAEFQALYDHWGLWVILIKGMTPIPYKLITIASGVAGYDIVLFGVASLISRAMRFYPLTALLWWFGPPIRRFVEKRLIWVTTIFVVFLFAGFLLLRYLF